MREWIRLSHGVTVGPQPSELDLRELSKEGFGTVVNLRTAGEPDQPLSPEEEGSRVKDLGMKYVHVPVAIDGPHLDKVEEFRREVERMPGPAFVHCNTGRRAGLFTLLHVAVEQGWTEDEALRRAERIGFPCEPPEVREFVKGYLKTRR